MKDAQKCWFLLLNGNVVGPLSPSELETKIENEADPKVQVWGKGLTEWIDLPTWRLKKGQYIVLNKKNEDELPNWKVRIEGREMSPMSYEEMISLFKTMSDFSTVDLWSEGFTQWKEFYSIHRVVEDLGLSRRSHPRVPIMGTLQGECLDVPVYARVISISEGGLGITEAPQLKIDDMVKGTLTSPNLFLTIICTCRVVYVGKDGYVGLKFASVPTEAKNSILAYVSKFSPEHYKEDIEPDKYR